MNNVALLGSPRPLVSGTGLAASSGNSTPSSPADRDASVSAFAAVSASVWSALGFFGGVQVQNRGTIGGNIVNASPAADSPPALLVYDAELELRLKKEYAAVFNLFRYCVLTQDATYLCNRLDLQYVPQPSYPFFHLKMEDVWVWDKNRPTRIIPRAEVWTSSDVTVEELRSEGDEPSLTAEALAEYHHKKMREELGIAGEDAPHIRDLFHQKYRGSRYSFGYPACPNLEDQTKLFALLHPEENVGVRLTSGFLLDPEQSTSAIVLHRPMVKHNEPSISWGAQPMARSTCDGVPVRWAHAEPEEAATPHRSRSRSTLSAFAPRRTRLTSCAGSTVLATRRSTSGDPGLAGWRSPTRAS